MKLGDGLNMDIFTLGSLWQLKVGVNGYEKLHGNGLVTQAVAGRKFEIISIPSFKSAKSQNPSRIMVRLLEDGYRCWLKFSDIIGNVYLINSWTPNVLNRIEIEAKLPQVLKWVNQALMKPNKYLWGGTIGPDFDCSGLVQSAYSSEGIWLPRDSFQQEKFCVKVEFSLENFQILIPGDLVFFGTAQSCNHVAIYIGDGFYCHSSGPSHGFNGIGISAFNALDSISSYYQSIFRSVGRVERCHNGSTLF